MSCTYISLFTYVVCQLNSFIFYAKSKWINVRISVLIEIYKFLLVRHKMEANYVLFLLRKHKRDNQWLCKVWMKLLVFAAKTFNQSYDIEQKVQLPRCTFCSICIFNVCLAACFVTDMEISSGGCKNNLNMPPEVALHSKPAVHMLIFNCLSLKIMKVFAGLIRNLGLCSRVMKFFSVVAQWCS